MERGRERDHGERGRRAGPWRQGSAWPMGGADRTFLRGVVVLVATGTTLSVASIVPQFNLAGEKISNSLSSFCNVPTDPQLEDIYPAAQADRSA